jgi:hypothetical protein
VLPQFIAVALSRALDADVEWVSAGIVGATVNSIREHILPQVERHLSPCPFSPEEKEKELIVVVICGLNDWRVMVEQFPVGLGPGSFRADLAALVEELRDIALRATGKQCRVYLPALPIICMLSDPMCVLKVAPLSSLFSALCWVWDSQKLDIALCSKDESGPDRIQTTTFIGSPKLDSDYAVPGRGNISGDGVHPTNQGCKRILFVY